MRAIDYAQANSEDVAAVVEKYHTKGAKASWGKLRSSVKRKTLPLSGEAAPPASEELAKYKAQCREKDAAMKAKMGPSTPEAKVPAAAEAAASPDVKEEKSDGVIMVPLVSAEIADKFVQYVKDGQKEL